MTQEVKKIDLEDLVLWSENPRDPMSDTGTNQEIADRVISDDARNRWSVKKLRNSMEKQSPTEYHLNELPTVSYHANTPVVYDGNQRVLIGMLMHGIVQTEGWINPKGFSFPKKIDCNVCDKQTALEIVDRMHADNGTWKPLERDIFKHKHMGEKKSTFMIIDESTNIISQHPHLNAGFVRDEVFTENNLKKMGFVVNNGKLQHSYDNEDDAKKVLLTVSKLVHDKQVTTRLNRGKIIDVLLQDEAVKAIINSKTGKYKGFSKKPSFAPLTKRTPPRALKLFGVNLILKEGEVNDFYRDLCELEAHFNKNGKYSYPTAFIRMGMRLLCEAAFGEKWSAAVEHEFDDAKSNLSKDDKTTLSTQVVKKENIVELLQVGGHNYQASSNKMQTYALSLVLGQIIKKRFGK